MSTASAEGAVAGLAASQHGAISVAQAASLGLSPSQLRWLVDRGRLVRVRPGVLVVAGAPPTWRLDLVVATLASGGAAVVSHRAAAVLHGLDGIVGSWSEVSVPRSYTTRLPGVIVHRTGVLEAADCCVVDGLPVTALDRTVVDLASVVPLRSLSAALDHVLRLGVSPQRIHWMLGRVGSKGRRGAAMLRGLLTDRTTPGRVPESALERALLDTVAAAGLPPPRVGVEIRDGGRLVARVDVGWPELTLGLEAHSKRHHAGWHNTEHDLARDLAIAALGWEVLYVTWAQLRRRDELAAALRSAYRARARLVGGR